MLSWLKNIFTAEETPLQLTETHEFGVSTDGIATIRQMKNGKFRLLVNGNEVIGTYARLRDARRGATRKGLTVVEA
jgi:hypothetical protein